MLRINQLLSDFHAQSKNNKQHIYLYIYVYIYPHSCSLRSVLPQAHGANLYALLSEYCDD